MKSSPHVADELTLFRHLLGVNNEYYSLENGLMNRNKLLPCLMNAIDLYLGLSIIIIRNQDCVTYVAGIATKTTMLSWVKLPDNIRSENVHMKI